MSKFTNSNSKPKELMIALIPPSEEWPQYVAIKKQYLKQSLYKRGRRAFPHITLAQTKYNNRSIADICEKLKKNLKNHIPFCIKLDGLKTFNYGKTSVIYVVPTTNYSDPTCLTNLPQAIKNSGFKVEEPWVPHVGLGSVAKNKVQCLKQQYTSSLKISCFDVNHVFVLARGSKGPWATVGAVPLSGCEKIPSAFSIGSAMDLHAQQKQKLLLDEKKKKEETKKEETSIIPKIIDDDLSIPITINLSEYKLKLKNLLINDLKQIQQHSKAKSITYNETKDVIEIIRSQKGQKTRIISLILNRLYVLGQNYSYHLDDWNKFIQFTFTIQNQFQKHGIKWKH